MSRLLLTLLLGAGLIQAQPLPLDGIAHVGLRVSNLERSAAYYSGLLGYQQSFVLRNPAGEIGSAFFKVNEEQYVELTPGGHEPFAFTHVAFETPDIEAVRRLLAARGVTAPPAGKGNGGNLVFSLQDPEKHRVEFVQYQDGSLAANARGKFLDTRRISSHLQHVGVVIPSDRVEPAMHFYHDLLGLEEVWRYAPGGELRLIKLATTGKRRDIVELMITPAGKLPTRAQYGSMYHINFEVPEITAPYRQLLERGAPPAGGLRPVVNAENIWAINLYDPDGTRTEVQDLRKVPAMRLGLVGLEHGHVAGFLNKFPGRFDAALVGVAEPDAALARKYAEKYKLDPALFYTSLEAMLDRAKPQAVVVFTNTADHLRVVEACAARGIHVMMEKPLSVSLAQARAMQAAARRGKIQVLVNYETTWHRSNQAAIAFAAEPGALGPIRKMVAHDGHRGPKEIGVQPEFLAWLSDPARNGAGALFDFGCYGADLMTWLMHGERPLTVTAVTQHMKPEIYPKVDDEATIVLTYPGAQGIIQASWNWPFDRKDLEIYGASGAIRTVGMDRVRRHRPGSDEEEVEAPPLDPRYDEPMAYLTAVVRGEVQPAGLSSLEVNVVVMEILDAARRSAASGQTVKLGGSR